MTEGPPAASASRAANRARVPAKFLLRHSALWGQGGDARSTPAGALGRQTPGAVPATEAPARGGRWGLSEEAARPAGAHTAGEEQCQARREAGRRGRGCLPPAVRRRHVGPLECAACRGAPFNRATGPASAPPRPVR